jgi:transcriptional regulator with PAS, ATPase and Fis domain
MKKTRKEVRDVLFKMGFETPAIHTDEFIDTLRAYSESEAPILIIGETGVGKELIAEAIHKLSKRNKEVFKPILCSGIPDTLMESELFGYKKGAFTGATRDKSGLFEIADKGTIFLDEIADMPMLLQGKLLRVLNTKGKFSPLGDTKEKASNARIIAATNKEEDLRNPEKFRFDLYQRINVLDLKLPSLREEIERLNSLNPDVRWQDIRMFFIGQMLKKSGSAVEMTEKALKKLSSYHWPGNYRELERVLEKAYVKNKDNNPSGKIKIEFSGIKKPVIAEGCHTIIDEDMIELDGEPRQPSLLDIKLKDIFEHADRQKASMILERIKEEFNQGHDIKTVLIKEGLPEKKYQAFRNKVERATGKRLKEIKSMS